MFLYFETWVLMFLYFETWVLMFLYFEIWVLMFLYFETCVLMFLWMQIRFKRDQNCCGVDLLSLVYINIFIFALKGQ